MKTTVTKRQARANVSAMIRAVEDGDQFVIEAKDGGKPLAICIPYEKYEDFVKAWAELQIDGKR